MYQAAADAALARVNIAPPLDDTLAASGLSHPELLRAFAAAVNGEQR